MGPIDFLIDFMPRPCGALVRNGELGQAMFSHCERYRYLLTRTAAGLAGEGTCGWVMLNPSTADPDVDDATIRRCRTFATSWGYRWCVIANLWAWRSTDPRQLVRQYELGVDPVGPLNDAAIVAVAKVSHRLVLAWGNHGNLHSRAARVRDLLRTTDAVPHVLRVTGEGQPIHPLYQPRTSRPVPWSELGRAT